MKAFWASSYHEAVHSLDSISNGKPVLPCQSQFRQRRHLEDHIDRVRSNIHSSSTPTIKNKGNVRLGLRLSLVDGAGLLQVDGPCHLLAFRILYTQLEDTVRLTPNLVSWRSGCSQGR